MIYDGKKASLEIKEHLRSEVSLFFKKPILTVVSVATDPSITSFIKIKRVFGESIGVTIVENNFEESFGEDNLILHIKKITDNKECDALIVQLPLPSSYNAKKILSTIPLEYDVDCLGEEAYTSFVENNYPIPPVAGAVSHIIEDAKINYKDKKIVILGQGKLVGIPVREWFLHKKISPSVVDIETDNETRSRLLKEADIIISGIGKPHYIKPEFLKKDVVLIDAGTSEQAGVLAGDCDPLCKNIASLITPVPGGVGPLTVACLFKNVVEFAKNCKKN